MAIKPQKVGIRTAFKLLCEDVGSPYARACLTAFVKGGLPELERVRASFSPSAYHDVDLFAADYLVHSYLSKLDLPGQDLTLEDQCLLDFLKVEARNKEWNHKLKRTLPLAAEELIFSVQRKIRAVLGPVENLFQAFERCDWGPGATYSLASVESTRDLKILETRISITARAVPYFLAYVQTDYHWFAARTGVMPDGPVTWLPCNFDVVRGERFSTAPKKWNKRRTISIQPTGNLFLQKGFGNFVRSRLKRWGVDLDDQSKNQLLALFAQILGFATLDLKEASNSMLQEHIRLFFDEPWVNLMEALRCHEVRLPDGTWHRLELHSGMGNGYTFEVESLIFWAIAQSVCDLYETPKRSSVYGDDVIVPSIAAERTIEAFEGFGFRINTEKSFIHGRFYESCGTHAYDGQNVTPLYEKTEGDSLQDCIRSYNRLYRWCASRGCVERFRRTLDFLELRAHQALYSINQRRMREPGSRSRGSRRHHVRFHHMPYQAVWMEGDGGLITEDLRNLPDPDIHGIWTLTVWTAQPVTRESDGWSMYSDSLKRDHRETACYGLVAPRDHVKWKFSRQRYYRWAERARCLP